MDDWLAQLSPDGRVLDLASASGSFSVAGLACSVIAVDEDLAAVHAAAGRRRCVCGRLERLPIASSTIDLVVCNHALEHIGELEPALAEIGRVLKPSGRLYVAIPDGYGFCDGLYRWLFEGGGHVNRFRRPDLVRLVESHVGLRLARWQRLYSSFGYLRGIPDLDAAAPDLQARLRRIAHLPRGLVYAVHAGLYAGTRLVDRCAGTSSAAYGWALWFDRSAGTPVEDPPFVNVCIHLRRRTCARRFRAPLSGLVVRFLRAAQSILVRAVNQATMRFPYAPLFLFSRARRVVVRGG